jgi:hypothetical protein
MMIAARIAAVCNCATCWRDANRCVAIARSRLGGGIEAKRPNRLAAEGLLLCEYFLQRG